MISKAEKFLFQRGISKRILKEDGQNDAYVGTLSLQIWKLTEFILAWLYTGLRDSRFTLLLYIALRCLNVFLIRTYYVPDEYWQSLEVAHHYVFGYGYLTWEWLYKVRSHVYVIWIVWLYKLLKLLSVDTVQAVILGPRVVQSVFSAIADAYYVAFVRKYFKPAVARWAVFVYTTNFFIVYCATRTLTNTVEMNLCIIAMYYFPWTSNFSSVKYLWFVGISCAIKPTTFIYWLPLSAIAIYKSSNRCKLICLKYIPVTFSVLLFATLLDWYMFGELCFTWYRFFSFNILHNVNSWYSTQSLFWYLYAGLPVTLGLYTIFLISFTVRRLRLSMVPNFKIIDDQLLCAMGGFLFVLSIVSHKEFRFLLPVLPLTSIFVAHEIYHVTKFFRKCFINIAITIFIVFNALLIIYIGGKYQSTRLNVMDYLRSSPDNNVLFLLPCHATPLYSHLHMNVTTRFLRCDPPLPNISTLQQLESTVALQDPNSFLEKNYNGTISPSSEWPTHVVISQNMKNIVSKFLVSNNYTLLVDIDDGLPYYVQQISMSVFVRSV